MPKKVKIIVVKMEESMENLVQNLILYPLNQDLYVDDDGFLHEENGDAAMTGTDDRTDFDVHAYEAWNQIPNARDPRMDILRKSMQDYEKMVEAKPHLQEIVDIWLVSQHADEDFIQFGLRIENHFGFRADIHPVPRAKKINDLYHDIEAFLKGDEERYCDPTDMFKQVKPSTILFVSVIRDLRMFVNEYIYGGKNSVGYVGHKFVTDTYDEALCGHFEYRGQEYDIHANYYGSIWWE